LAGKFQGLLVGGLFVHLPFLVRRSATEGDRISSFRATEELMLRCGSAFTEVLFLGKAIDEVRARLRLRLLLCVRCRPCPLTRGAWSQLAGHTYRISTLFRALDMPPPASAQPDVAEIIAFRGVTVCAPEPGGEPRVLVRDLNLEVPQSQNLIVTGPNGSGAQSARAAKHGTGWRR
jgi:hypothetical protein